MDQVLVDFERSFLSRTAELLNLQTVKYQLELSQKDAQLAELSRQLAVITVPEHIETEMKSIVDLNSQLTESLAESQLKVNELTVSNQQLLIKVGGERFLPFNCPSLTLVLLDVERELQMLREASSSNGTSSFTQLQRQNQQLMKENRQLHDRILAMTDDLRDLEQQHHHDDICSFWNFLGSFLVLILCLGCLGHSDPIAAEEDRRRYERHGDPGKGARVHRFDRCSARVAALRAGVDHWRPRRTAQVGERSSRGRRRGGQPTQSHRLPTGRREVLVRSSTRSSRRQASVRVDYCFTFSNCILGVYRLVQTQKQEDFKAFEKRRDEMKQNFEREVNDRSASSDRHHHRLSTAWHDARFHALFVAHDEKIAASQLLPAAQPPSDPLLRFPWCDQ